MEVGPLSRGVTFKPLSRPLQPGVRFLHHPLPAFPSAFLAIGLPTPWAEIRAYPVPYQQHEQVRSCLSTGGTFVDVPQIRNGTSGHLPFWLGRTPLLSPFFDNGVYQQFTCVDPTAQPDPLSACSTRTHPVPSRERVSPSMRRRRGASHAAVTSHALPVGYD